MTGGICHHQQHPAIHLLHRHAIAGADPHLRVEHPEPRGLHTLELKPHVAHELARQLLLPFHLASEPAQRPLMPYGHRQGAQLGFEQLGVHGLGQEVVASLGPVVPRPLFVQTRQKHHRHPALGVQRLDGQRGIEAAHAGHQDVHEHNVNLLRMAHRHGGLTTVSSQGHVATLCHLPTGPQAGGAVVVHHQHLKRARVEAWVMAHRWPPHRGSGLGRSGRA